MLAKPTFVDFLHKFHVIIFVVGPDPNYWAGAPNGSTLLEVRT